MSARNEENSRMVLTKLIPYRLLRRPRLNGFRTQRITARIQQSGGFMSLKPWDRMLYFGQSKQSVRNESNAFPASQRTFNGK